MKKRDLLQAPDFDFALRVANNVAPAITANVGLANHDDGIDALSPAGNVAPNHVAATSKVVTIDIEFFGRAVGETKSHAIDFRVRIFNTNTNFLYAVRVIVNVDDIKIIRAVFQVSCADLIDNIVRADAVANVVFPTAGITLITMSVGASAKTNGGVIAITTATLNYATMVPITTPVIASTITMIISTGGSVSRGSST
jgi:hypothetical protein